jgi:hypothetical protein
MVAGVIGEQRMLTPTWQLILFSLLSGFRIAPFSTLYMLCLDKMKTHAA